MNFKRLSDRPNRIIRNRRLNEDEAARYAAIRDQAELELSEILKRDEQSADKRPTIFGASE
ncbi:hypothetical protein [Planctomicrobium piriforme]|uniref:Uncharacterized protein n=1 Tax=Planctomicrobium piriforme TaxID=1576369 RepID=A0A1I3C1U9_9PLAN|nr:hypothetical protein [Planctomicrobium piriforme]SFH67951.1 hypothetical protein SAMN05421753_10227 [Planctomicrobium piriforme]